MSGSPISRPNLPVILKAPAGIAAPQISGGSDPGATLSCSAGTWAGDVLESLAYRAPESLAYQWTRDGTDLSGAEAKTSSITATSQGSYRCRVTATNAAGATSQTSAAHAIGDPVDDPPTAVADQATVAEDANASAIDVLANDTDPDGGPREIASVQVGAATHGTVAIDPDHQGLTYKPAADYCNSVPGYDPATFTYKLNGGSQATVTVHVTCAGSTPPTLTATDPASPSAISTPKVKGTSPAAGTGYRIKLYVNDPTCSGPAAAESNVATFQGKGVAVGPLAVGTSQIRVTLTNPAGTPSACSAPISYTRLGRPRADPDRDQSRLALDRQHAEGQGHQPGRRDRLPDQALRQRPDLLGPGRRRVQRRDLPGQGRRGRPARGRHQPDPRHPDRSRRHPLGLLGADLLHAAGLRSPPASTRSDSPLKRAGERRKVALFAQYGSKLAARGEE